MSLYDQRNTIIFCTFLLFFAVSAIYSLKKRQEGNLAAAHTFEVFTVLITIMFVALTLLDRGRGYLQYGFIPIVGIFVLILSVIRRGKT